MLPIGDDNSGRVITPYITYLLIALNVFVFIFLQAFGTNLEFTYAWAAVPAEILSGNDFVTEGSIIRDPVTGEILTIPGLQPTPVPVWLTLISSMFMHGSLAHIAGNMLYLFIFGDNIENRIGHRRYFYFYILTGIIASLCHVFTAFFMSQSEAIPSLGASGAISGVMGGYLILFPHNRVRVWMFRFITEVRAYVALGFWIVFQLVAGLGMLGGEETGVAYGAHIGGFFGGMLLVKFYDRGEPASASRWRN